MSFTISKLSDPTDIETLTAEWEELDSTTAPRTPFSSPAWNRLWWRHFRKNSLWVKDELLVLAVRSADTRLVAVAPFFLRRFPSFGPIRAQFIQFFGADSSITELRGIVSAPLDAISVSRALSDYLRDEFETWDFLLWHGGKHTLSLNAAHASRMSAPKYLPNYFITLPASWLEMQSRLTGKFKRNMRKRYETLKNDGFTYTFRCAEGGGAISTALETFFSLHRMRALMHGMEFKHPDRFADRKNRSFITEYVAEMAKRGRCRIFEVDISGATVASQLAFELDSHLWLYSSGYDPKWRKYGIMTMLTAEILKWAVNEKLRVVNLSCGQDLGKLRWNPAEIIFTSFLQSAPNLRGKLLMRAYEMISASRQATIWLRGYRRGKGRVEEA